MSLLLNLLCFFWFLDLFFRQQEVWHQCIYISFLSDLLIGKAEGNHAIPSRVMCLLRISLFRIMSQYPFLLLWQCDRAGSLATICVQKPLYPSLLIPFPWLHSLIQQECSLKLPETFIQLYAWPSLLILLVQVALLISSCLFGAVLAWLSVLGGAM